MNESEMIKQYKELKLTKESLKEKLSDIEKKIDDVKQNIIDVMTANGVTETASYIGIGKISLTKPKVKAWVTADSIDQLCDYLQDIGRDDLIKRNVHHKSLCKFAEEQLEMDEDIPEFINTTLIPDIRLYSAK